MNPTGQITGSILSLFWFFLGGFFWGKILRFNLHFLGKIFVGSVINFSLYFIAGSILESLRIFTIFNIGLISSIILIIQIFILFKKGGLNISRKDVFDGQNIFIFLFFFLVFVAVLYLFFIYLEPNGYDKERHYSNIFYLMRHGQSYPYEPGTTQTQWYFQGPYITFGYLLGLGRFLSGEWKPPSNIVECLILFKVWNAFIVSLIGISTYIFFDSEKNSKLLSISVLLGFCHLLLFTSGWYVFSGSLGTQLFIIGLLGFSYLVDSGNLKMALLVGLFLFLQHPLAIILLYFIFFISLFFLAFGYKNARRNIIFLLLTIILSLVFLSITNVEQIKGFAQANFNKYGDSSQNVVTTKPSGSMIDSLFIKGDDYFSRLRMNEYFSLAISNLQNSLLSFFFLLGTIIYTHRGFGIYRKTVVFSLAFSYFYQLVELNKQPQLIAIIFPLGAIFLLKNLKYRVCIIILLFFSIVVGVLGIFQNYSIFLKRLNYSKGQAFIASEIQKDGYNSGGSFLYPGSSGVGYYLYAIGYPVLMAEPRYTDFPQMLELSGVYAKYVINDFQPPAPLEESEILMLLKKYSIFYIIESPGRLIADDFRNKFCSSNKKYGAISICLLDKHN